MNVSSDTTRDYKEKQRFWLEKNKANSKPILGLWPVIGNETNGCGMTRLNGRLKECDLKKQSQFTGWQNDVKSA